MRLRISFSKTQEMRYTSHLDLHRTWERTLRRARLPLAYSQGFNPHPKINLASALPLGMTGEREIIDVWLDEELAITTVQAAIDRAAPPGIHVNDIQPVPDGRPSLQTELEASKYIITFLEPVPGLDERVNLLLSAETLPRQRRGKDYDLRPLVFDLARLPDSQEGLPRLSARLSAQESATGRPEEVIDALGVSPENTRVHRVGLVFKE